MDPYLSDDFIRSLPQEHQNEAKELNRNVVEEAERLRGKGLDVDELLIRGTALFNMMQTATKPPSDPDDECKEWSVVVAACLHALPLRSTMSPRQQRWAATLYRLFIDLMKQDFMEHMRGLREAN